MNPSDGTMVGGGGGSGNRGAALVGTWGSPPAITFNANGTGFLYNPTPFNWTATATMIALTNIAGGEPFSITMNWSVIGGNLHLSNPAGTGDAVLAILITIGGAPLPPTSGDSFPGATLNLSGPVWMQGQDSGGNWAMVRYGGNRTVTSNLGGSGAITNGELSFSIGAPSPLEGSVTDYFVGGFGTIFDDISVSVPDARSASFGFEVFEDGYGLTRGFWNGTVESGVVESVSVSYIFVDQDVVVTGSGRTNVFTRECQCEEWFGACYCEEILGACNCPGSELLITQDFSLNLSAGWNALHFRIETLGATDGAPTSSYAISLGDPANLRWEIQNTVGALLPPWQLLSGRLDAKLGAPLPRAQQQR